MGCIAGGGAREYWPLNWRRGEMSGRYRELKHFTPFTCRYNRRGLVGGGALGGAWLRGGGTMSLKKCWDPILRVAVATGTLVLAAWTVDRFNRAICRSRHSICFCAIWDSTWLAILWAFTVSKNPWMRRSLLLFLDDCERAGPVKAEELGEDCPDTAVTSVSCLEAGSWWYDWAQSHNQPGRQGVQSDPGTV